ncbi:hypothetical protein MAPG_07389 [Magnaporthiopsis poae ATCC 64411]|uniref:Uncharacterized protein n=1 Tax=Magnaporthiopsis poae (strain ATCC 64411 / 73-15) TaxID=644358 RepID=A0A0C4E4J5_MAGP6|nr:hypothetical protein MAPG_07389 [Magnaporthiopsis poae ATCC 64411]
MQRNGTNTWRAAWGLGLFRCVPLRIDDIIPKGQMESLFSRVALENGGLDQQMDFKATLIGSGRGWVPTKMRVKHPSAVLCPSRRERNRAASVSRLRTLPSKETFCVSGFFSPLFLSQPLSQLRRNAALRAVNLKTTNE